MSVKFVNVLKARLIYIQQGQTHRSQLSKLLNFHGLKGFLQFLMSLTNTSQEVNNKEIPSHVKDFYWKIDKICIVCSPLVRLWIIIKSVFRTLSNMGHFAKIANCFRKTLHLRCLARFWTRFWLSVIVIVKEKNIWYYYIFASFR